MFEEQVGWIAEGGVDYVVGETFSWGEESLLALDAIQAAGLPSVMMLTIHSDGQTREGWTPEEACRRLADAGADVVGLNCARGPATMLPLIERVRAHRRRPCCGAARPVPHDPRATELPVAARPGL